MATTPAGDIKPVELKQNSKCNKRFAIGMVGLVGGLLIHLVIGALYQWGIINIYITSYHRILDDGVSLEGNAIAFPLMMICIGITIMPGLWLAEKTHPCITIPCTVLLQAVVIFSSSFIENMIGFIIVYGVLFGLASGLNFMVPIYQCNKYFPGKKMYVNGFILTGTGFGSVVFGLFSYNFLNPQKLPPNQGYYIGTQELQYIAHKVPQCLRWLSLLYLMIGLFGSVLISKVCILNRRHENQLKEKQQQIKKARQIKKSQSKQLVNTDSELVKGDFGKPDNEKRQIQNPGGQQLRSQGSCSNNYEDKDSQDQDQVIENTSHQNTQQNKNKQQSSPQNPSGNFAMSNTIERSQVSGTQQPGQFCRRGCIINHEHHFRHKHVSYPKTLKQVFCSKVCWLDFAIVFFGACGIFLMNGNYKTYVKAYISNDEFLTIVGVVASVGNGTSRFFWNLLFNKTGYRLVILLNVTIQIIVYATIRFTVHLPGVYMFLIILINCCIGGFFVMTPTFLQLVFSQKTGSQAYGFFWQAFGLANLLQYIFVSQLAKKITFDGVIYICLGMAAISGLLVIFGNFQAPWHNPQAKLGYFRSCRKRFRQ